MYEEVLAIRRDLGEDAAIAEALYNLSFSYWLSLSDTRGRSRPRCGAADPGRGLDAVRTRG
jgi:hypothetical protein